VRGDQEKQANDVTGLEINFFHHKQNFAS